MLDQETLQEYLDHLADRFYAFEIVERLEDAGIIDVQTILALLEDYIIEGRSVLEE